MSENIHQRPLLTVEVARSQAHARIESYFNEAQVDTIKVGLIPELLESQITPVAAAVSRCNATLNYGMMRQYLHQGLYNKTPSKRYLFTQSEMHAINDRPEIRSLSVNQLAEAYDVSRDMIARAAQGADIAPVFATCAGGEFLQDAGKLNPKTFTLSAWFDLDQTQAIKDALQQFNAPPEYISEAKLLSALRIAPVALKDICNRLEIKSLPFHNPEAGQGEMYLTKDEVSIVFAYVKNARHR